MANHVKTVSWVAGCNRSVYIRVAMFSCRHFHPRWAQSHVFITGSRCPLHSQEQHVHRRDTGIRK